MNFEHFHQTNSVIYELTVFAPFYFSAQFWMPSLTWLTDQQLNKVLAEWRLEREVRNIQESWKREAALCAILLFKHEIGELLYLCVRSSMLLTGQQFNMVLAERQEIIKEVEKREAALYAILLLNTERGYFVPWYFIHVKVYSVQLRNDKAAIFTKTYAVVRLYYTQSQICYKGVTLYLGILFMWRYTPSSFVMTRQPFLLKPML